MPKALVEVEELSEIIKAIRRHRDPDAPIEGVSLSSEEKGILESFIIGILFKELIDAEEIDELVYAVDLLEKFSDLIRLKICSLIIREKITGVNVVDMSGSLLVHFLER